MNYYSTKLDDDLYSIFFYLTAYICYDLSHDVQWWDQILNLDLIRLNQAFKYPIGITDIKDIHVLLQVKKNYRHNKKIVREKKKKLRKSIRVIATAFITTYINKSHQTNDIHVDQQKVTTMPNSWIQSVHNDHEKELEIILGPPEPNYQDIVLTTHRKKLKIILVPLKSNYRRRHSTYRTYLWSNIQRYQSIRARTFDWPIIDHQFDELL